MDADARCFQNGLSGVSKPDFVVTVLGLCLSVGRGAASLRRVAKTADGFAPFMQRIGGAFLADAAVKSLLQVVTRYTSKCERLSPEEYPNYRARLDDMAKLLDDEMTSAPSARALQKKSK
jgi:hypothetical protein